METQVLSHQDDSLGENNSVEGWRNVEGLVKGGDSHGATPKSPVGESNPEKEKRRMI